MDLDISGPSSYISSLHSFTCLCIVGWTDKKSVLLQWEHRNWFWPWNPCLLVKNTQAILYAAYVRQGTSFLSILGPNHEKGGSWSSNDAVWKLLATPSDQLTPKNDVEHMDHPLILFSCICKVADWGKWVCLSKKKITNKKPSYFIPRTPDVCHVIVTELEGNTCSIILEEWTYQQLLFAYSINSPPWSP